MLCYAMPLMLSEQARDFINMPNFNLVVMLAAVIALHLFGPSVLTPGTITENGVAHNSYELDFAKLTDAVIAPITQVICSWGGVDC